jgi:hypothetical protein
VAYYFNGAFMNSDAHESDLKQQQIEEKEEEKLENSIVLVYSLSLPLSSHFCLIILLKIILGKIVVFESYFRK